MKSQSQIMKEKLYKNVVPGLIKHGYLDEYPMFYKKDGDFFSLIYLGPAKGGNAVTIEASYVYLDKDFEKNNIHRFYKGEIKKVKTTDCIDWYWLKAKYKYFYYTDVYIQLFGGIDYYGVSIDQAKTFRKPFFHFKVQKYDDNIYEKVCSEINNKIFKVYKWLEKKHLR